jgi:4-amino-4-deoxy-L-arabinose transferase-like glycosyltransferase
MNNPAPGRLLRWYALGGAVLTAVAGVVAIGRVDVGRVYLAAAARTMSGSWWSFWHTSFDPGDFLTVEKPPLALWVQALSVRVFGFGGWQLLWPSIAAAAVTCAVLTHVVGRRHGTIAALCTAMWFATTPGVVALSRSNHADIFVLCFAVGAVGAWLRALETNRVRWWVLSSVCLGLGLLAKGLYITQILPGLAIAAVWAGRKQLWRTGRNAAASILGAVALGGSWSIWMDLHDRSGGPYVAHTTRNSAVEQMFGWGSLHGPRWIDAPGFAGQSGALRVFDIAGDQAYWMFAFAAVGMSVVGGQLWRGVRGRGHVDDVAISSGLVWCGWLLSCAAVFSFTGRVVHDYYITFHTPALIALAAIGVRHLVTRFGVRHILAVGACTAALHVLYAGRSGGPFFAVLAIAAAACGTWLLLGARTRSMPYLALTLAVFALLPSVWSVRGVLQPSIEWNPVARVGEDIWVNHDPVPEVFYTHVSADPDRGRWWFAVPTYSYAEHGTVDRGVPILAAGGFNASTSATFSVERLTGLIDDGSLRYVITGAVHPYDARVEDYLERNCPTVEQADGLSLRRC